MDRSNLFWNISETLHISGDHFPLEARHHLAPWLDQNFTTDLDLANPQHEEHAQRLVLELVAQLESKVSEFIL